jgi:hypothetical protein
MEDVPVPPENGPCELQHLILLVVGGLVADKDRRGRLHLKEPAFLIAGKGRAQVGLRPAEPDLVLVAEDVEERTRLEVEVQQAGALVVGQPATALASSTFASSSLLDACIPRCRILSVKL